jgi:hypothetical protein
MLAARAESGSPCEKAAVPKRKKPIMIKAIPTGKLLLLSQVQDKSK